MDNYTTAKLTAELIAQNMEVNDTEYHTCPVCQQKSESGLTLERYLKSLHLLSRSYSCDKCSSTFENCQVMLQMCTIRRRFIVKNVHICQSRECIRDSMFIGIPTVIGAVSILSNFHPQQLWLLMKSYMLLIIQILCVTSVTLCTRQTVYCLLMLLGNMEEGTYIPSVIYNLIPQFNGIDTWGSVRSDLSTLTCRDLVLLPICFLYWYYVTWPRPCIFCIKYLSIFVLTWHS